MKMNWRNHPVVKYFIRIANILIEMAFLLLVCFASCAVFVYVSHMFWYLYMETPMGYRFCASFPDQAHALQKILSFDILRFAFDLTMTSFVICTAIGTVSRFFHFSRHFYLSMGLFYKFIFWGVPLSAGVSFYIHDLYGLSNLGITSVFAAIPTYILFMSCFRNINHLIPEFGYILRLVIMLLRHTWSRLNSWVSDANPAVHDYEDSSFSYGRFREKMTAYRDKQP